MKIFMVNQRVALSPLTALTEWRMRRHVTSYHVTLKQVIKRINTTIWIRRMPFLFEMACVWTSVL